MDVEELVTRCRAGDALAWEALVRRFQARVYGLALHYVRNAEEARDVAQEIFVRVYRRLDGYRDTDAFLPWLLRVGRNVCIDHLRRLKARPAGASVPVDAVAEFAHPGPTPEAASEAADRRRLVHRAMQGLSEPTREIILLKEIQGLGFDEIASLLDIPLGTAKSRSNRARIELARAVLALGWSPGAGTLS